MLNKWMQNANREAEIQLLEEMAKYDDVIVGRIHDSIILDPETQALIKWRNLWYGSAQPIEDMTPIMQIGNSEPIGYFDKSGQWYPAEQPAQLSYEMLVEYEQCGG